MGWTNDIKKGTSILVDIASDTTQGIVLPTLREETCLGPTTDLTKSITMTTMTNSDIKEDSSTDEFEASKIDNGDTDTGDTYFAVIYTKLDLKIYDIKTTELFPTSWCTAYSTTITTITPGVALTTGTFCSLLFDDTERYIDF